MRRIDVPWAMRRGTSALALLIALVLPAARAQTPSAHSTSGIVKPYTSQHVDWAIVAAPSPSAPLRGALAQGAFVTTFNQLGAPGCKAPWWQLGADAWMCPDNAQLTQTGSSSANGAPTQHVLGYVVVGKHGTLGYAHSEDVDVSTPNAEMQPGFMLGFTQRAGSGDAAALLTTHDFWIPAHDVQLLSPSEFEGVAIDNELEMGWVIAKRAQVFASPDVRPQQPHYLDRLTRVSILGQQQRKSGLWIKLDAGWVKSTDLRIPELQPLPSGIGTDEHWIDVNTKTQTLVAYVGTRPVFATLVSTGKGKPGTEQATPLGLHRIWIKLTQSDMDNLDSTDARAVYAVEAVPNVMFFEGGYGIHGTYWHDDFGIPKSHGCVNVSLSDAAWLFQFVSPHLPLGWSAVFPTSRELGTVVNVH